MFSVLNVFNFGFSCGSTAQFWASAASMKLSVSFRLLDLGQSAVLLGRVISSSQGFCVSAPGDCEDGEVGGMNGFWQGKPKYSEKPCPDVTLSTTNPTCQTRARTRAAAVGSERLNRFSYGAANNNNNNNNNNSINTNKREKLHKFINNKNNSNNFKESHYVYIYSNAECNKILNIFSNQLIRILMMTAMTTKKTMMMMMMIIIIIQFN
jgi:hypothetical protein